MKVFWGVGTTVAFLVFFSFVALAQEAALPKADVETALKDFSQMNDGNKNMILGAMGIPQAGGLDGGKTIAILIFSGIGFVAFVYGKKNSFWKPLVLGILLMGYPYFLTGTWAVFLVGIALTLALYLSRD